MKIRIGLRQAGAMLLVFAISPSFAHADGFSMIGERIWALVSNSEYQAATALPSVNFLPSSGDPMSMEHWRSSSCGEATAVFRDPLGMSAVTFKYKPRFNFGGKY